MYSQVASVIRLTAPVNTAFALARFALYTVRSGIMSHYHRAKPVAEKYNVPCFAWDN